MTREEGCEWYQLNHYDFAYNRLCFLDTLKGLVSRCKSQKTGFSVYLIELTVGVPLLGGCGRWLYEQKLLKYRTLVAVSAILAQLLRRQVAYGYMGCSAMCHLGTIFLVA
jgi:hypothetical protein